jgi:hypothetical protein
MSLALVRSSSAARTATSQGPQDRFPSPRARMLDCESASLVFLARRTLNESQAESCPCGASHTSCSKRVRAQSVGPSGSAERELFWLFVAEGCLCCTRPRSSLRSSISAIATSRKRICQRRRLSSGASHNSGDRLRSFVAVGARGIDIVGVQRSVWRRSRATSRRRRKQRFSALLPSRCLAHHLLR